MTGGFVTCSANSSKFMKFFRIWKKGRGTSYIHKCFVRMFTIPPKHLQPILIKLCVYVQKHTADLPPVLKMFIYKNLL